MARFSTQLEGATEVLRVLGGAKDEIRKGWKAAADQVGVTEVRRIRREFRTVRSATSTGVQSGALRRSYGHAVKERPDGIDLEIGAIAPVSGRVPLHARVHEGYDAFGNRVSRFVIKPKNKPYLHFPIFGGGGRTTALKNITGWVRTKGPIILKPRPSLDSVAQRVPALLDRRAAEVFRRTLNA